MGAVTESAVNPITGVPYNPPPPQKPPAPKLTLVERRRIEMADHIFDIGADGGNIAYISSIAAQCGLPHTDPGHLCGFYKRENGNTALTIVRGTLKNPYTGNIEIMGYPYGPKPRLMFIDVCTQAILTQSPHVDLGRSMSDFMRRLGISPNGGLRGQMSAMKEQLMRFIACHMQLYISDEKRYSMVHASPPIKQFNLWLPNRPHEVGRWEGMVTLGDEFFACIMDGCVPMRQEAIRALQNSSMDIDTYTWLNSRLHRVTKPVLLTRHQLHAQFGPDYAVERFFWRDFTKRCLPRVKMVYPDAKFEVTPEGMKLFASRPSISKTLSASRRKLLENKT
jgi:hypothetical protein